MKIFTFWEPKDRMPGYIKACMRTWRFIPDAEIVVLDYGTIGSYLSEEQYRSCTCRSMSLPKQSDAYRAVLLEKYGGVWLDADTVILPQIVNTDIVSGHAEVTMFRHFGEVKNGAAFPAGAFIYATKPHAKFMRRWADEIPERIATFARFRKNPLLRCFSRPQWRICRKWDYCVNAIINPLVAQMKDDEFKLLDMDDYGVFPECASLSDLSDQAYARHYAEYYFTPGDAQETENSSKGLIMLHNSWTPQSFRGMSEDAFLSTDTRLALLLRHVLKA